MEQFIEPNSLKKVCIHVFLEWAVRYR